MHPFDLVTRRAGHRIYQHRVTPIRRLRSARMERAWWAVKRVGRLWTRYRAWRLPDSYVTPPKRNAKAIVREEQVYDGHQRLTLDIDRHTSVTWLTIDEWVEDRELALWYGPPRKAAYLFTGDDTVEWLREMLEHAEELLGPAEVQQ
jgi:hypothetical protein